MTTTVSTTEKRKEKARQLLNNSMAKNAPIITLSNYKLRLIQALNWHNEFTEEKELKKIVLNYVKDTDYYTPVLESDDCEFKQLGVIIFHKERGDYIGEAETNFISKKLDEIKRSYVPAQKVVVTNPTKKEPTDKVLEQARIIASAIDSEIDSIMTKKSKGDFSVETLLKTNNATESVSRKIASFYEDTQKELKNLLAGDEYLKEAYSHITKPHAKRILTFIETVIGACQQNAESIKAKKVRKPRAKKKKPPTILVAKLQYLREDKDLKIKSVDPKEIIGAKQVWLYNVKYKKLTKLVADNPDGLTVKGTTVLGFDIKESQSKRLRKPETVLSEISKKSLNFHMKKLKTKDCEVNGRVNKDTIILTV